MLHETLFLLHETLFLLRGRITFADEFLRLFRQKKGIARWLNERAINVYTVKCYVLQ